MDRAGKVLITGHRGQLGSDLVAVLSREFGVAGFDLPEGDICDADAVFAAVRTERPDLVIHAAAQTDVDGCESDRETAMAVNVEGTRHVALACAEIETRLIYYSTDYVFNGKKSEPYVETDRPDPGTAYGLSKLMGERVVEELVADHAILRIAWVYGRAGRNFVKTMIQLGRKQIATNGSGEEVSPLRVVNDQFGNPTWSVDIARQTLAVLDPEFQGVFHATAEREATWYEFACDIFRALDMPVRIQPCTTQEYPRPAPRPRRSSLENRRLKAAGKNLMRDYREAVEEFLAIHGRELAR